jgi:amino acid transporter
MGAESPAAPNMAEKGTASPPGYEEPYHGHTTATAAPGGTQGAVHPRDKLGWATRNGLTLESFTRREAGAGGEMELDKTMKKRHLNMIAIGGSIGAGFFVGSGGALATGGPGSLLIDFVIIGVMMFNVVFALGELAVMYPVSGSFYTYSTRFIDSAWGFAMGWNYVLQWAVVLPLELTVCGLTIGYWNDEISVGVWITVFLVVIIIINVFGTLGYAEEEFWASVFKLSATIIFLILALVMVLGGGPEGSRYDEYQGAKRWHERGAFNQGFYGFCAVFVTAAFSFSGTELVGLAAAESKNPAKSLPGAIKQVFWRITLFYVLGLLFISLLIDYWDKNLISESDYESADANTSPFVLVGKYANLHGFDHFMNVVIIISVLSIGCAGVYGGSRTLTAMGQQGYAPRFFGYIDKSGRPLWSVVFIIVFGVLAYVNLNASGPEVFAWLQALSGLAALLTWGSICLAHIRFRAAWKHHGHTLDEIPFRAVFGVWGSWLGLVLNVLVLIAQFYVAVKDSIDSGNASDFFKAYLTVPVVIAFWLFGYFWKHTGWLTVDRIDVDTGRREHDWDEIRRYREQKAAWPAWRRILRALF